MIAKKSCFRWSPALRRWCDVIVINKAGGGKCINHGIDFSPSLSNDRFKYLTQLSFWLFLFYLLLLSFYLFIHFFFVFIYRGKRGFWLRPCLGYTSLHGVSAAMNSTHKRHFKRREKHLTLTPRARSAFSWPNQSEILGRVWVFTWGQYSQIDSFSSTKFVPKTETDWPLVRERAGFTNV